jgi:signal transduction histidine kinase
MPLLDDAGGSLGAIEVYRDVTAEARTQAHYKVLLERARTEHERLEEEVRTRTDALRQAQAQLVHQEKMSSLGRLVAGVTHELNNPLHFVSGNLSFLERYATVLLEVIDAYQSGGRDAGRQAADERDLAHIAQDLPKLLKSVRNGAERASRIVRSLRTFSHPGRDRAEPADLEKCLRSSLEIVEPMLKGRVEVDVRMDGLPPVVCNSSQLGQVFLNLLTNAADAIEGPGHIRVSGSVDGEFVEVRLADDGVGIAPADLQRLFEPFFTTKPVGSGTGLGLSISYAIVRDHGGSIQASSEPGRGTTFMVRLPIRGGGPAASA